MYIVCFIVPYTLLLLHVVRSCRVCLVLSVLSACATPLPSMLTTSSLATQILCSVLISGKDGMVTCKNTKTTIESKWIDPQVPLVVSTLCTRVPVPIPARYVGSAA
jgi:hypothetical protein